MPYNDLRKGRYSESGREYLVTVVTEGRRPAFGDFYASRLLIREMRCLDMEGALIWQAWVIMPDHMHGLISLPGKQSLSEAVNLLKGRSARAINELLGCKGAFWQAGFHDHALRREEDRLAIARYIVANPLRAGLAAKLGDYPHWDSIWL